MTTSYQWTPQDVARILTTPVEGWTENRGIYFLREEWPRESYCGCALGRLSLEVEPIDPHQTMRDYCYIRDGLEGYLPEEIIPLIDRVHEGGKTNQEIAAILAPCESWSQAVYLLQKALQMV